MCAGARRRAAKRLLPAGVAVTLGAARAPHGRVALEAAAETKLPDPVTTPHSRGVLDVGQNVPAEQHTALSNLSHTWVPWL
jgi:hypothetical protein